MAQIFSNKDLFQGFVRYICVNSVTAFLFGLEDPAPALISNCYLQIPNCFYSVS